MVGVYTGFSDCLVGCSDSATVWSGVQIQRLFRRVFRFSDCFVGCSDSGTVSSGVQVVGLLGK